MSWLDTNAEGLALMFWIGCLLIAWLSIAAVVEQLLQRHQRRRFDRIDLRRCERAGSQHEFARRLHARLGR